MGLSFDHKERGRGFSRWDCILTTERGGGVWLMGVYFDHKERGRGLVNGGVFWPLREGEGF